MNCGERADVWSCSPGMGRFSCGLAVVASVGAARAFQNLQTRRRAEGQMMRRPAFLISTESGGLRTWFHNNASRGARGPKSTCAGKERRPSPIHTTRLSPAHAAQPCRASLSHRASAAILIPTPQLTSVITPHVVNGEQRHVFTVGRHCFVCWTA